LGCLDRLHFHISFYHWELFIIFSKISIEFIIILVIKKCNPLDEGFSKLSLVKVFEIINVERDGSDLRS